MVQKIWVQMLHWTTILPLIVRLRLGVQILLIFRNCYLSNIFCRTCRVNNCIFAPHFSKEERQVDSPNFCWRKVCHKSTKITHDWFLACLSLEYSGPKGNNFIETKSTELKYIKKNNNLNMEKVRLNFLQFHSVNLTFILGKKQNLREGRKTTRRRK